MRHFHVPVYNTGTREHSRHIKQSPWLPALVIENGLFRKSKPYHSFKLKKILRIPGLLKTLTFICLSAIIDLIYQGRIQVWAESAPAPLLTAKSCKFSRFWSYISYSAPLYRYSAPSFYKSWIRPCLWCSIVIFHCKLQTCRNTHGTSIKLHNSLVWSMKISGCSGKHRRKLIIPFL